MPWSVPRNVFVFTGEAPALLDTGYQETGENLVAALDALGLDPWDIQRVALTSYQADACGAVSLFSQASVWSAAEAENALTHDRARHEAVLDALLQHPDRPQTWTRERADAFLALRFGHTLPAVQRVEDGQPLMLGGTILDALKTEGVGTPSCAYYAADRGWLFGGPTVSLTPRPIQDDPGALIDSMTALGSMSVKRVLPVQGMVEEHPQIFFRSLSLYTTNLRTNMQYIFSAGPQSSIDLAFSDFGYLPEDMLRFSALVLEYDSVFREFAQAGVIRKVGEGLSDAFPRYQMGTPPMSRGPSQPR